jgi:hypothetical protein
VQSVRATSIEDASVTVSAGRPLAIEGAAAFDDMRFAGDIAIFARSRSRWSG